MRGLEQIRFMNMEVLAKVLDYYVKIGSDISNINEDNFNFDVIKPYFEGLLTTNKKNKDEIEKDLEIMEIRMAATFLRYIMYVNQLKEAERMNIIESKQIIYENETI